MAEVEIIRDWPEGGVFTKGEPVVVKVGSIHATIMQWADKHDPHEQKVVAVMLIGHRFGIRVTADRGANYNGNAEIMTALIAAVIEHHAEIRDALALERG